MFGWIGSYEKLALQKPEKTSTKNFRISYFSSCGQPTVEDEELSGTCNYWLEVRLSSKLLRWDSLSNWDNPWNLLQVGFSLRYAQSFSLSQITKLGGIYSIWGEKCGKNLWKFERLKLSGIMFQCSGIWCYILCSHRALKI